MTKALRALALTLTILLSSAPTAFCQTTWAGGSEPAWLSLERGKKAYAAKDFGSALVHFDNAISLRRDSFTAALVRLDQALDTKAAKAGEDSIARVLAAFAAEDFIQRDYINLAAGQLASSKPLLEALRKERLSDSHRAFIDVLLSVLEYRPMQVLGDSIAGLRTHVQLLSKYPEAELWKGKVFFLEGELPIAETQYRRAYDMSPSLEIPEERFTILYAMAALYDAGSNFVAWENIMKSIVAGNDEVIDPYLRDAMMATLLDQGFDRFMTLYRLQPSYSLEANAALGSYYLERGRAAASMHAAIAVNMTLTQAISMLVRKDSDYVWKGLDDFMERSRRDSGVVAYLSEARLPRLLLTLADALYISGARITAAKIWKTVVAEGTAPFAAVAQQRITSPASAVRRQAP